MYQRVCIVIAIYFLSSWQFKIIKNYQWWFQIIDDGDDDADDDDDDDDDGNGDGDGDNFDFDYDYDGDDDDDDEDEDDEKRNTLHMLQTNCIFFQVRYK